MDLKTQNRRLLMEVTNTKMELLKIYWKLEDENKKIVDIGDSNQILELKVEELGVSVSTKNIKICETKTNLEKSRVECDDLKETNKSLVNVRTSLENQCEDLKLDIALIKKTCKKNEDGNKNSITKCDNLDKFDKEATSMKQIEFDC